jgi:HD-GYP domain-containing protein (c-di-GMP phosphodiesterase class II)
VLLAAALSALASKSTAKPLSDLVRHLQESERTGRLRADFQTRSSVWEVNELARAFNRAAVAIGDSQARLDRAYLEFIETMAQALDARDPYTAGHSSRVCAYSLAIAKAMGLSPGELETLRVGAELHDIGKIGIPDAILQKAGPLTREEFGLIKLHPQIGKKILEKVEKFRTILPIVELHHEDFDGRGYPYGQRSEDTPLLARIVRVADAYDAMSTNRAYRRALDLEQITTQLVSGKGRQFDPEIVDVWLSIANERDKNEAFHSFDVQAGDRLAAVPALRASAGS